MTNKDIITPVTIIGVGVIAFLLLRRRNINMRTANEIPQGQAGNEFINDPTQAAYSPSLAPQLLNGGNINIDIKNQGLQYLSNKYIPLFGFVGMAQGKTFH